MGVDELRRSTYEKIMALPTECQMKIFQKWGFVSLENIWDMPMGSLLLIQQEASRLEKTDVFTYQRSNELKAQRILAEQEKEVAWKDYRMYKASLPSDDKMISQAEKKTLSDKEFLAFLKSEKYTHAVKRDNDNAINEIIFGSSFDSFA